MISTMHTMTSSSMAVPPAPAPPAVQKPNLVFLHCESTDGRTYLPGSIVPIPNIRKLMNQGVSFDNHYVNVPICCPSRASLFAGRQPHNIPHQHNEITVGGAWNNYEGVGADNTSGVTQFDQFHSYLGRENYTLAVLGKTDWMSGSHSLTTMLDSFSIYMRPPYSYSDNATWHIWGDCGGELTVNPGNQSAHAGDWKTLQSNVKWIKEEGPKAQPFFAYQGFGIVHPPYRTSENYLARIPVDKITIPEWPPLETMHPCDMQTSFKKGCAQLLADRNTTEHKRAIRAGYYAMIAEYDDMVGAYVAAVEEAGLRDSTIFILSSDHGDMQMEHQQFYKMVAYEASSHVPLVIAGPPGANPYIHDAARGSSVQALTSMVDLFPTFLDLAQYSKHHPEGLPTFLDGTSLVPFLSTDIAAIADTVNNADVTTNTATATATAAAATAATASSSAHSRRIEAEAIAAGHPTHIISQFHGENLAMSWYMVRRGEMKYVAWGTGSEHEPQLFNLTADPHEMVNLALQTEIATANTANNNKRVVRVHEDLIQELDALLKSSVDYPKVSMDVAQYNLDMARWWVKSEPAWAAIVNGTGISAGHSGHMQNCLNKDWGDLWQLRPPSYWEAWHEWINGEAKVTPCPSTLEYKWNSSHQQKVLAKSTAPASDYYRHASGLRLNRNPSRGVIGAPPNKCFIHNATLGSGRTTWNDDDDVVLAKDALDWQTWVGKQILTGGL